MLAVLVVPLGIVNARGERRRDLTAKVERDAVAVASLAEARLERDTDRTCRRSPLARRYAADAGGVW